MGKITEATISSRGKREHNKEVTTNSSSMDEIDGRQGMRMRSCSIIACEDPLRT